ncbi:CRISPR-associated protein Cas5 [Methanolobus vulcani]|uniref:CRISPR-associated protein Cas5 n=1 Tax=Methanolobus vulcani TaxID=38026 RepID=UPI0018ACCD31|nr:CRISPR-associated protein Cas5 [Methanolobus vulcani]
MNTTLESFSSTNGKASGQPNKVLIFRLHGIFAHFNQPISNRFRNTYSIIPKPQLLGIIGSLIGLSGYKNSDTCPEFYSKLHDLKVFIKPNGSANKKFVVTYNSLNSFLNNRVDTGSPNVMINEQILQDPDYEIGLLLNDNDSLHSLIIENITQNKSVFPIYLGKNEFFASIEYISLNDYEVNSEKEVSCSSIFPFDELSKETTRNLKLELLPIDFDDMFKYVYCLMAIPQNETKIELKNPDNCIVSEGSAYYVF